jgi:hypothetical protein
MRISVLFLFLALFIQCDSMKDYKLLYAEENFDDSFRLKVYYKDALSFGPQLIRIIAERTDEKPSIILKEKIYNDGQNLQESNVAIKWLEQSAEITIRGKEQERKKYIILRNNGKYEVSIVE